VEASVQNPDRQSEIERLADSIRPEQVVSAVQRTARALQEIQHYVNIQLAIETLMLELPQID
jgi:hypothetical protein